MIHLRLRTEYSFRRAYGRIKDVIERATGEAVGITDNATWGHVQFFKAAKEAGKKALLGVEVDVVQDAARRERQYGRSMALLPRNGKGLKELYHYVSLANDDAHFYYHPRLDYNDINSISHNVIVLSGAGADLERLRNGENVYLEMNPSGGPWNEQVARERGWQTVVCADNYYPSPEDRQAWEILIGSTSRGGGGAGSGRTSPMHIPTEDEMRMLLPMASDDAFLNTERIAAACDVKLPKARMVKYESKRSLRSMCMAGARRLKLDLKRPEYRERLEHELKLIIGKKYEDYFYVIADMVNTAKRIMLVGPARGSSAGSLVCYLCGITDIDPLKHGLMFERFIDTTRSDLPDIDIDFPDARREEVWAHLIKKYGEERVGHLGTILRYKAKSALRDVAKALNIPPWEIKDLQGAIIERSSGDARAQFCIADAFETLDVGKAALKKYPQLKIASVLEGHAQYSGTHAAGYLVADSPIKEHCSISHDGTTQIDKKDAESVNLLKIDALGLRTLTVLNDCLERIGKDRDWLIGYPLDDKKVFKLFNEERYAGIFQFEGYALQILTRQMGVKDFNDVAALTALARPGPLHGGGAAEFVARRIGDKPIEYLHPLAKPFTKDTYGTVIYQEQVMAVSRVLGDLSWEDVNQLRRAMSKSLGDEFFNKYWEKFKKGAAERGIKESRARSIWKNMVTFGSWAFNKSHAISYGTISYWCAVLKTHYPLEFAASTLTYARDEEQVVRLLRELTELGIKFTPVDPEHSEVNWSIKNGRLIGGLINIKGIGEKKARDIIVRREAGVPLAPGQRRMLDDPVTPYDHIFEARERFGDMYDNPRKYKILTQELQYIRDIHDIGEYVFLGKLKEKNLRDLNEYGSVVKRGGRIIKRKNLFLNLLLEDDTGTILATIGRYDYERMGKPIIESAKIGDWFLWKGKIRNNWRMVAVSRCIPAQEHLDKFSLSGSSS